MKAKTLKESRNELELEIEGETFTIVNLLNSYLLKQAELESAFKVEHTLIPNSKIMIRTERGSPKVALKKAIDQILQDIGELEQLVESLED